MSGLGQVGEHLGELELGVEGGQDLVHLVLDLGEVGGVDSEVSVGDQLLLVGEVQVRGVRGDDEGLEGDTGGVARQGVHGERAVGGAAAVTLHGRSLDRVPGPEPQSPHSCPWRRCSAPSARSPRSPRRERSSHH